MGLTENTPAALLALNGLDVRLNSAVSVEDTEVGLTVSDQNVAVLAPSGSRVLSGFEGESSAAGDRTLVLGPVNATNLNALRDLMPWLRPRLLSTRTSAGFGDRLGLATPGHVMALRAAGGGLAPIFAQQSIREMERTGRSPKEVLDDATWGVFAEGWQEGFGADADHLKTAEDIDACLTAGYSFFTFDPGEYVDDRAEAAGASALRTALEDLPWQDLEDLPADLKRRYLDRAFEADGHEVRFDDLSLARAAVKYGAAVARVVRLYRHLQAAMGEGDFEVEVSVDETESPTTHAQHIYIATELRRFGVYTERLSQTEAEGIFARTLSGDSGSEDAARFTANALVEMAGMSVEDGLVMQLHAGSPRNHNRAVHNRFGPDAGADIPIAADWTRGLRALLDEWGNDPRFRLVVFGLDEAAYSRELAPLAGHYPALLLGAPWWFFDSPLGMRRYLDAVMETAGLYNTAGFNDDTRAFASIPSRHNAWRRITCDWLAGMVLIGVVDEEEAPDMAREFAYGLAKRAYGFQKEPVGTT